MTLILLIVMWAVLCLIILAMCVYSERVSCLHQLYFTNNGRQEQREKDRDKEKQSVCPVCV